VPRRPRRGDRKEEGTCKGEGKPPRRPRELLTLSAAIQGAAWNFFFTLNKLGPEEHKITNNVGGRKEKEGGEEGKHTLERGGNGDKVLGNDNVILALGGGCCSTIS